MNTGNVIALVIGLPTVFSGGVVLVSKLTRIAVAVEGLVESQRQVVQTIADHEKRLSKGGL